MPEKTNEELVKEMIDKLRREQQLDDDGAPSKRECPVCGQAKPCERTDCGLR